MVYRMTVDFDMKPLHNESNSLPFIHTLLDTFAEGNRATNDEMTNRLRPLFLERKSTNELDYFTRKISIIEKLKDEHLFLQKLPASSIMIDDANMSWLSHHRIVDENSMRIVGRQFIHTKKSRRVMKYRLLLPAISPVKCHLTLNIEPFH